MEELGKFGEFVEKYGFPALISLVVIFLLVKYFKAKIESVNEEARLSKEKASLELDLMKKQRIREMDRDDQITSLVMDVQNKQVEQLNNISENLSNMNKSTTSCYYEVKNIHSDIEGINHIIDELQKSTGETLIIVRENNTLVKQLSETKTSKGDD